jgi:hypothetical protein
MRCFSSGVYCVCACVRAFRDFMVDVLRVQHFCIKWCFKLWEDSLEKHIMRRTAFNDSALGRTQIFEWIFTLIHEENVWESGCPSTGRTDDCAEKSSRSRRRKPSKYLYDYRLRVRPLVWNIPANSKGGLECNCNCRGVVWERSDESVVSWMDLEYSEQSPHYTWYRKISCLEPREKRWAHCFYSEA